MDWPSFDSNCAASWLQHSAKKLLQGEIRSSWLACGNTWGWQGWCPPWNEKWSGPVGVVWLPSQTSFTCSRAPETAQSWVMLSCSFIFTEPLGRRPWFITENRKTTITQLCGDLKMRLFKWQQWAAFNPTWSSPPKPSAHCSLQHGLCCMGGSHLSPFHSQNDRGCPWIVVISATQNWDDVLKWCRKSDHPPKLNFRLIFHKHLWITKQWPCRAQCADEPCTGLPSPCHSSHIHTQRGVEFKCWTWSKSAPAPDWNWGLCSAWYKHHSSGHLH